MMHLMERLKWICICFFFFSILIDLIKTDRNESFPVLEPEDINTTMEIYKERDETSTSEDRERAIEDDNKIVRIFIVGGVELRTAIRDEERIWKDGIIPYEISKDYSKENLDFINNAIAEFHNKTCVRFKPRKDEKSYIFIMPGTGCSAGIGSAPQANRVILNEACFVKGTVLHELMHTLGFIHEQNRPDRDKFVRIMFDNIQKGAEGNFDKFSEDKVNTFNQTYDYGSVMHYGAFDFAEDKSKPTIVPLQDGVQIGQRDGFSEKDLIKINLLYNCSNRSNAGNGTQETVDSTTSVDKEEADRRKEKLRRFLWFYLISRFL